MCCNYGVFPPNKQKQQKDKYKHINKRISKGVCLSWHTPYLFFFCYYLALICYSFVTHFVSLYRVTNKADNNEQEKNGANAQSQTARKNQI